MRKNLTNHKSAISNYNIYTIVFLILFVLNWNSSCIAQQKITGKVLDKETGRVVEFCNVYVKNNNPIGTATNEIGEFALSLSSDLFIKDTLLFTVIGYISLNVPLKELIQNGEQKDFYITPASYSIEPVEIYAPSEKAKEIVSKAISRKSKNYSNKNHVLRAFYRESQINVSDSTYQYLIEADLYILDQGIKKSRDRVRVAINQMRRSDDLRSSIERRAIFKMIGKFLKTSNSLYAYNMHFLKEGDENFGWFNKHFLEKHNFYMYKQLTWENDSIVIIRFNGKITSSKGIYNLGLIHINIKDYAILKVEYAFEQGNFKQKKLQIFEKNSDGYYYPRLFQSVDLNQEKLLLFYDVENDNQSFEKVSRKSSTEKTIDTFDIQYTYDEIFWKNYNMLQLAPVSIKIVKDLERTRDLKEQFYKPK